MMRLISVIEIQYQAQIVCLVVDSIKPLKPNSRRGIMSFKDLEQKHNLVNMVILACGKHPVDADINPLLEERLERFYEDAVIEGMAKQMHSSVDRAVNAMGKEWYGLSDKDCDKAWEHAQKSSPYGVTRIEVFAKDIERRLKERNNAV
jgi:hypothetical protein